MNRPRFSLSVPQFAYSSFADVHEHLPNVLRDKKFTNVVHQALTYVLTPSLRDKDLAALLDAGLHLDPQHGYHGVDAWAHYLLEINAATTQKALIAKRDRFLKAKHRGKEGPNAAAFWGFLANVAEDSAEQASVTLSRCVCTDAHSLCS
jgi:hypothetical protein